MACIDLLTHILGGSSSSRLFSDLREKRHLAYSVQAQYDEYVDMGVMTLRIETTTNNDETGEKTLDNIKKSIEGFNENIARISTEKVSPEELENAKKVLKGNNLGIRDFTMAKNNIISLDERTPYGINMTNEYHKIIDSITPEDILNTARYIFKNKPTYSICGTQEALDANKEFLSTLGEVK